MESPRQNNPVSNLDLLERELFLKQLQINRLLEVTQAINDNLAASDLYKIYKDILNWEMGIKKLVLFIRDDDEWDSVASIGVSENLLQEDVSSHFEKYTRTTNLQETENRLLSEFDLVIPVYHKDYPLAFAFIGDLSDNDDLYEKVKFITTITNIISVAIENKRLFKRQLEQERLKQEIQLGAQVQNMLIPSFLPSNERFEFHGVYQPHHGVGGDYYDFIDLAENEFFFCISDISGKGVGAAILMSNFQARLQVIVQDERISFEQFVRKLNKIVLKITNGDKFITFFAGQYLANKRVLRYVNAGHNPPQMMMDGKLTYLDKGCTILGSFKDIPEVEVGEIFIDDEALIVSYTDGLTDLLNDQEEFFDETMLADFITKHSHYPVQQFNEHLMKTINRFKGDKPFPDDVSVLTCRIFK